MKNKIFSKGFTLVEMLIYIGLLSVLLLVLTDIFVSILDVKKESEATSSVEQDSRFILNRFSYDINKASSIVMPVNLGQTSNNLIIVIGGENYTYSITSGNLQLSNSSGNNNLNSSETNITNLSFKKLGNVAGKETVRIQFTINSTTKKNSGYESRTFQTTVGRR